MAAPSTLRFLKLFGAVIVAVLVFQNCDLTGSSRGSSSTSSTTPGPAPSEMGGGGGNGNGYDGKIYVNLLNSGTCADGSLINSKIEFRSSQALLARENCQDIPLAQQIAVLVSISASNPTFLTYNDRIYVEVLTHIKAVSSDLSGNRYLLGEVRSFAGFASAPKFTFIAKASPSGQILWSRELVQSEGFSRSIRALRPASNGSLVAVGQEGQKGLALALDQATGAIVWSKTYALHLTPAFSSGAEADTTSFTSIDIDANGTLQVGASVHSITGMSVNQQTGQFSVTSETRAALLKLSPGGVLLDGHAFKGSPQIFTQPTLRIEYTGITSVRALAGGDTLLHGTLDGLQTFTRINSSGQNVWSLRLTGRAAPDISATEPESRLPVLNDGSFIAPISMQSSAQNPNSIVLARVSSSGSPLWIKRVSSPDDFLSMIAAEDLGQRIHLVGSARSPSFTSEGLYVQLNSDGNLNQKFKFDRGVESALRLASPAATGTGSGSHSLWLFGSTPIGDPSFRRFDGVPNLQTDFALVADAQGEFSNCLVCRDEPGLTVSDATLSEIGAELRTDGPAFSPILLNTVSVQNSSGEAVKASAVYLLVY